MAKSERRNLKPITKADQRKIGATAQDLAQMASLASLSASIARQMTSDMASHNKKLASINLRMNAIVKRLGSNRKKL